MTHHSRLFRRAVAVILVLAVSLPVAAHDGVHTPDMLADVTSARVSGNTVTVVLTLTGLGGPLVLTGVTAVGADAQPLDPVYVNFAEDVEVRTMLRFAAPPPGIFTLVLDFGPVGQGSVVVIPNADPAR